MKPILFPKNETQFNTNGLGRLADAVSCLVTEERNGSYELEMDYPITGLHYSDIQMSGIIYAKPADGKTPQAFRIYKISKPINGIVTINAEHISYQLSHIPVGPFEAETVADALLGLSQNAAETCPFTFWTDKTTIASFSVKQPVSIRSQLGGVQGSILDVYGGGDYEFDMYTVKLHQNRGFDRGVTLRYGKNITDIKQEENIQNTYTGVMPFWKNGQDDDATLVMLTEKVLHSANASNFPYQRTIPLDLSSEWQEEPTEAQLRAKATAYMTANNIGVPAVSIDVDFVALWQTEEYKNIANLERVNLCDTVTVEFPKLDISATAKVVKTTYDVLAERYKTIELGDARSSLSKTISDDIREATNATINSVPSQSFIRHAINRATELLRGGLGGYVVMGLNANGEPQEILIMDDDDISQAVNVIRINKNGIGFSSNGYEGPFESAWTIDGHFVADFITSGTLSANLISGGTLKIGGGDGTEFGTRGAIYVYDNVDRLFLTLTYQGFSLSTEEQGSIGYGNINIKNTLIPVSTYDSYNDYPSRTRNIFGVEHTKTDGNTLIQNVFGIYKATDQVTLTDHPYPIDYKRFWLRETDEIYTSNGYGNIKNAYRFPTKEYMIPVGSNPTKTIIHREATGTRWTYQIDDTYNQKTAYLSLGFYRGEPQLSVSSGFSQSASDYLFNFFTGHEPAYASTSSKRFKCEIAALQDEKLDPKNLLKLEVKQFKYKDEHPTQYPDMKGLLMPGFIAEDVDSIYPSATIHDKDGNVESWDERRIIPGMLALIQEQYKTIQSLENRIKKLENLLTDDRR